MECAHPHLIGHRTDESGDAIAHFLGRFVGEGDRQNVHWVGTLRNEIGDALGEHARLTRSGTGHYQQWATGVNYCVMLVGIETRQVKGSLC